MEEKGKGKWVKQQGGKNGKWGCMSWLFIKTTGKRRRGR